MYLEQIMSALDTLTTDVAAIQAAVAAELSAVQALLANSDVANNPAVAQAASTLETLTAQLTASTSAIHAAEPVAPAPAAG
jgi:hypothetical protein